MTTMTDGDRAHFDQVVATQQGRIRDAVCEMRDVLAADPDTTRAVALLAREVLAQQPSYHALVLNWATAIVELAKR